nr:glutathione S-transferase kappa 1-like [Procambarus clarkii]
MTSQEPCRMSALLPPPAGVKGEPPESHAGDPPISSTANDAHELMVKGSLVPSRFLTAIDLLYPDYLEAASRALWMEVWNKDEDITTQETLERAGEVAGLTKDQLAHIQEHMTQEVTKNRLETYTEEAVQYGAFGLPAIVAHTGGEPMLFFGSDRFPVLAQEIGEKWLGPEPDVPQTRL